MQAATAVIENPACWKMHRALAHCFLQQHRPQFAAVHLARSIDSFRENDGTPVEFIRVLLTEEGRAFLQDGRLDRAQDCFERALVYEPPFLPAKAALAEVAERQTAKGSRGFNGHPLLDQGHALEREGRYDDAWDCYVRAKTELQAKGFKYDRAIVVKRFNAYRSHCTAAAMWRLDAIARRTWTDYCQRSEISDFTPIFILGYPRSGTTLLEQMLCGNPAIEAGGELPYLVEIVNSAQRLLASKLPYPFCLAELGIADTEIALAGMRDHYLNRVRERAGGRQPQLITDKMPLNECYLPFLHLLFPYAPKILIRRDPRDVVVSNFSLFLTHGSHQADSPQNCFDHINLVTGLVNHYRTKMAGIPLKLIEIQYEELARNPKTVLERVCGSMGLDFSDPMLHPESSGRYAHTASYAQVREPVTDKSIGRWRRFEQQLRAAGVIDGGST